jgi:cytochrome c oxidase subunit 2
MWVVNVPLALLHGDGGVVPRGTRTEIFSQIFDVFLLLGTVVGVVVVSYTLYHAVKYRDGDGETERAGEFDPPELGELPSSSGGGRKLFVSLFLSTVIIASLILWTYGTLQFVEANSPAEDENALDVEVVGYRFGWTFVYPNGHTSNELRVPSGRAVELHVTSKDVFHTFGVPGLRVKTDAIPGQHTDTWFKPDGTGTYEARCYELCGVGHSQMTANVTVMEPVEFREWYDGTGNASETTDDSNATNAGSGNASSITARVAGGGA